MSPTKFRGGAVASPFFRVIALQADDFVGIVEAFPSFFHLTLS
jgi:hypothetical protein